MPDAFDDIRLRDLVLLDRLAALGSLSAVAAELGVPKATASRWLAALEERAGQSLVRRTTRSLALTDSGRLFRERAREMLKIATGLRLGLRKGDTGGTIRVSVPVPMGRMLAGPVIAAFRRAAPGVRLEIRLENERIDLLSEGVDLAIRGGPLPDSTLVARKLAVVPMWLYASTRFRDAPLEDVPFISAPGDVALTGRSPLADRISAPAVIVDDRTAVADAIGFGAGLGLLPAFLGDGLEKAGEVFRVESLPVTAVPVHALFHESQRGDPRLAVLIDAMERQLVSVL